MFFASGSLERPQLCQDPPDYQAILRDVMKLGCWSPHPRQLVQSLGHHATALLMHACTVGKQHANEAGWVPFGPGYVANGLTLSAQQQEQLLSDLSASGYLATRMIRGQRYVRVDQEAVYRAVRGLDLDD